MEYNPYILHQAYMYVGKCYCVIVVVLLWTGSVCIPVPVLYLQELISHSTKGETCNVTRADRTGMIGIHRGQYLYAAVGKIYALHVGARCEGGTTATKAWPGTT